MENIKVLVADASHEKYVDTILETIRQAARKRGTGIAERTHEYVATKMKEGKAILAKIKPTDRVIAMCIKAKAPDSVGLSEMMQQWSLDGKRNVFIIGGSNGLSDEVIARADEKVSFSNLTFPHGLMRVILLEQLYRAERIRTGEKYHK